MNFGSIIIDGELQKILFVNGAVPYFILNFINYDNINTKINDHHWNISYKLKQFGTRKKTIQ